MLRSLIADILVKSYPGKHPSGWHGRGGSLPRDGNSADASSGTLRLTHSESLTVNRNDPKELRKVDAWVTKKTKDLFAQGKKNVKTVVKVSDDKQNLTYSIEYDADTPDFPQIAPKIITPPTIKNPTPLPPVLVVKPDVVHHSLSTKPSGMGISNMINFDPSISGPLASKIKANADKVIKSIATVHGIPDESKSLTFSVGNTQGDLGDYFMDNGNGSAQIKIKRALAKLSHGGEATIAHELGHWLDHSLGRKAGGPKGITNKFLTELGSSPWVTPEIRNAIGEWAKAVASSHAVERIRELRFQGPVIKIVESKHPVTGQSIKYETRTGYSKAHLSYLLKSHELFARSYAQYIGKKTGLSGINEKIQSVTSDDYPKQWTDDDFEPIYQAMDKLLVAAGLAK